MTAVTALGAAVLLILFENLILDALLICAAIIVMAVVGMLLAIRVPGNRLGSLLLIAATALLLEILGAGYSQESVRLAHGAWPATNVAAWVYSVTFAIPVLILTTAIPLIYPDGRLISPRWRWLVAMLVFATAQSIANAGFRPGLIPDTEIENPFAIPALVPILDAFNSPVFSAFGISLFVGALASVAIRFRHGGPVERAQLKWLLAATGFAVSAWSVVALGTGLGIPAITTAGWYLGLLAFSALPIAIGIAVLRYRLYEIDRIISRTIAWGVVTGVLVGGFVAAVVALQTILANVTQRDTLAVAVSTLAAAALAQPLRRRVQRAVDRRFDRARYDGEQTIRNLEDRLRDETDGGRIRELVMAAAIDSVRPTQAAVWLRRVPS